MKNQNAFWNQTCTKMSASPLDHYRMLNGLVPDLELLGMPTPHTTPACKEGFTVDEFANNAANRLGTVKHHLPKEENSKNQSPWIEHMYICLCYLRIHRKFPVEYTCVSVYLWKGKITALHEPVDWCSKYDHLSCMVHILIWILIVPRRTHHRIMLMRLPIPRSMFARNCRRSASHGTRWLTGSAEAPKHQWQRCTPQHKAWPVHSWSDRKIYHGKPSLHTGSSTQKFFMFPSMEILLNSIHGWSNCTSWFLWCSVQFSIAGSRH